jgi:PDZ domain-containing protein
LPYSVKVASGGVGGPSAGLLIALTVYDKVLAGVDLAAGRTIAGTGTIDWQGRVGPVGGAGLKVIAAAHAKADVFLVPAANAAEARASLPKGADMDIVEIKSFDQARDWLERTAQEQDGDAPVTQTCPYEAA